MNIDFLTPDPRNVRRSVADLAPLVESIKALGVLQPILARPGPDGVAMIVCGERRWKAAKLAGLTEVPVEHREMTDAEARAAQLAENVQRAGMSVADIWQAVHELQAEHGYTLQQAGAALGLDAKAMRQMSFLGRMHPSVLQAIREFGEPDLRVIRVVAAAPAPVQANAIKAHTVYTGKGKKRTAELNWWSVRNACLVTRIPQSLAIFDIKASSVLFEEDLFAEPGQDSLFTSDVDGFVAAQRQELARLVEQRKADGWAIDLGATAPKGYREHGPLHGAKPDKVPAYEGDKRLLLAHVSVEGYQPGAVVYLICLPTRASQTVNVGPHPRQPPTARAEIDKKGQAAMAAAKAEGVRTALVSGVLAPSALLKLLLVALSGSNVRVAGEAGRVDFGDVAQRLVLPDGSLADEGDEALALIAIAALQRMVAFAPPGSSLPDSGPAGDWIGRAVHAQFHAPRFDTPEFLASVSGAVLKELAMTAGVKPAKASTLRLELSGKLPEWRPVDFSAPGPERVEINDAPAPADTEQNDEGAEDAAEDSGVLDSSEAPADTAEEALA